MENISQMSLIEVAVALMEQKRTVQNIYTLIKEVLEMKGLDDPTGELATELYVDITTSSKFVYMGNDEWDLKLRQSLDQFDKDGASFNPKSDDSSDDTEEEELDDSLDEDDLDNEDDDEDGTDHDDEDDEDEEDEFDHEDDEDLDMDDSDDSHDDSLDESFDEDKYNEYMDEYEDEYDN